MIYTTVYSHLCRNFQNRCNNQKKKTLTHLPIILYGAVLMVSDLDILGKIRMMHICTCKNSLTRNPCFMKSMQAGTFMLHVPSYMFKNEFYFFYLHSTFC